MRRKRYFSFPKRSDQLLGLPSMLFIGYRGCPFPRGGGGLKRLEHKPGHLPPSTAEVMGGAIPPLSNLPSWHAWGQIYT